MRDSIYITATPAEVERFLDDMAGRKIPDLHTDAATDSILQRFTEQYQANRKHGQPVRPERCEGGARKACTDRPKWRVREKGDTAVRNWVWACNRHLPAACAGYGEFALLDVIQEGLFG